MTANTPIQLSGADANSGFLATLDAVAEHGFEVAADVSSSTGSNRPTRELLNLTLQIERPGDRLIRCTNYATRIVTAMARFVWMMAGSDRLADIAFYEPKVQAFSDDGVSVPGSNYGMRILQSRPGLNQLDGVIEELKLRPSSRRALVTVYQAEDAARQDSKDIPCTLAINFAIRNDRLLGTTLMRSNNAIGLLPFNIFEFTLLAEVVAREVGVELGPYSHFALSMHIYQSELARAKDIVAGQQISLRAMPKMPAKPLSEINALIKLEAEMRHQSAGLNDANIESWIKRAQKLSPYWAQFYLVLLYHAASQCGSHVAESVRAAIEEPYVQLLPPVPIVSGAASPGPAGDLFGHRKPQAAPITTILDSARMKSLKAHLERHVAEGGAQPSVDEIFRLQRHFGRLAARGDSPAISKADFSAALASLRVDKKAAS